MQQRCEPPTKRHVAQQLFQQSRETLAQQVIQKISVLTPGSFSLWKEICQFNNAIIVILLARNFLILLCINSQHFVNSHKAQFHKIQLGICANVNNVIIIIIIIMFQ